MLLCSSYRCLKASFVVVLIQISSAILLSGYFAGNPACAQRAERGGTGDGTWEILKQPVALPDLPAYTGQSKFVNGLMYPNKPGGAAITLRFLTREEPGTVIDWYSGALSTYQWSKKPSGDGDSLRASKGKNGVMIRVAPSSDPVYRGDLRISYKLASRH